MQIQRPKIAKIIQADYQSFLAVVSIGLCWGIFLILWSIHLLIHPNPNTTTLLIKLAATWALFGLVITLTGATLFFLRLLFFLNLFGRGIEAKGSIKQIQFNRGHGLVEFTYVFRGDSYLANQSIRKSSATTALKPGEPVTLIVDETDHGKVLLRDIYLDQN